MTTDELVRNIEKTYRDCVEIVKKKNKDYTDRHDAFGNFRFAERVGVNVEKAILVRMLDKLARISNVLKNSRVHVKNELVKQTLNDLINYAAILKAYLEESCLFPKI